MAFYDLHCADCNGDFMDVEATVAQKTEMKILCPACGSNRMEKIYSPVSIHMKKSEPVCPNSSRCSMAGCRHMQ